MRPLQARYSRLGGLCHTEDGWALGRAVGAEGIVKNHTRGQLFLVRTKDDPNVGVACD
jgi:hypothetical protein